MKKLLAIVLAFLLVLSPVLASGSVTINNGQSVSVSDDLSVDLTDIDHGLYQWRVDGEPFMSFYAPFEGSQRIQNDFSGNGIDYFTNNNRPFNNFFGQQDCLNGYCFESGPTTSFAGVGTDQVYHGADGITVSTWIKVEPGSSGHVFGIGAGSLTAIEMVVGHNGLADFSVSTGSNIIHSNPFGMGPIVDDGQYHHLVGRYDTITQEISLYVDGQFVSSFQEDDLVLPGPAQLLVGARPFSGNPDPLPGLIDEFQIFPRPLSDRQIELLYQASGEGLTTIAAEETQGGENWEVTVFETDALGNLVDDGSVSVFTVGAQIGPDSPIFNNDEFTFIFTFDGEVQQVTVEDMDIILEAVDFAEDEFRFTADITSPNQSTSATILLLEGAAVSIDGHLFTGIDFDEDEATLTLIPFDNGQQPPNPNPTPGPGDGNGDDSSTQEPAGSDTTNDEDDQLLIDQFRLADVSSAGDTLNTRLRISEPERDMEDVKITLSIPNLGVRQVIGPVDIDDDEEFEQRLSLRVPEAAPTGYYPARLVIQAEDGVKLVEHREIWVENESQN